MSYSYPNLRSHTSSPEPATYIAPNHTTQYTPCFCRFRVTPGLPLVPGVLRARRFFVSPLFVMFLLCYLFLSFWKLNDLQSQVLKLYRKMETIVFWDCGGFCFGKICPKVLTHFLVTTSSERKKSRQAKFALLRNHSLHVLMLAYLKSRKGMLQIVKANYGSASQVGDI